MGDEEYQTLVREIKGQHGSTRRSPSRAYNDDGGVETIVVNVKSGGGGGKWQLFSIILLGVIILFATDTIEIKKADSGNTTESSSNSEIEKAAMVQLKHPVASTDTVAAATPQEQPQPQQQGSIYSQPENNIETKSGEDTAPKQDNNKIAETAATHNSPKEDTSATGTTMASSTTGPSTPENIYLQLRASGAPEGELAFKTYRPRGQPRDEAGLKKITDEYGTWNLDVERPTLSEDIYDKYPNRDIPRDQLPANAWQTNTDYLSKFLPEGIALVNRAIEGIINEYGQGNKKEGEDGIPPMFRVHKIEIDAETKFGKDNVPNGHGDEVIGSAGWTTTKSWEGLKRRLLHALMTEDYFVFAMVGHSAAAGHGNHFQQSYTLQVQWILEAVFARLGVRHQSRNFGNGGLGTTQHGMGAGSVFGPDVDMLMWDSGMTEREQQARDLLIKQALLSDGKKMPVLWTIPGAQQYGLKADIDFGFHSSGDKGIPQGSSVAEIEKMPWAAQYVHCNNEIHSICRANEYIGKCWVERDDFTPTKEQNSEPGGRASWHPGNRIHQKTGRTLAMAILQALREVLVEWNNAPDKKLEDNAWHVTEYYDKMRANVQALDPNFGECNKYEGTPFMCHYGMKARTEFTPRAYPAYSNIRNLMPPKMLAKVQVPPKEPAYYPPDVFNPSLHPPPDAVDVLTIVEAGGDFKPVLEPQYPYRYYKKPTFEKETQVTPLGKGIYLDTQFGDRFCDGSCDSWCKKGATQACLLYNHNDGRNGLLFAGYSGWMVMNIPDLKNGFITIKVETWHFIDEMKEFTDIMKWTSINNGAVDRRRNTRQRRHLLQQQEQAQNLTFSELGHDNDDDLSFALYNNENTTATTAGQRMRGRRLKRAQIPYCDDFKFEYAIDGKKTSLNLEEYKAKKIQMQRVVEVIPLLADPNYTGGKEMEVEVAIRLVGCGNDKVFNLNHIYWS